MTTSFYLSPGYSSLHNTQIEEIRQLIKEITPEQLLEKCKQLGIEQYNPEYNSFMEYCEHYLTEESGFFIYPEKDFIRFGCGDGGEHRHVAEFVIKVLCLMIIEKSIQLEYNIDFTSS